jgi:catabolite regulation protein CreA
MRSANQHSKLTATIDEHDSMVSLPRRDIMSILAGGMLTAFGAARQVSAFGAGQREIGEIQASGLIFKDTIKVTAFQDPKVEGVQLYVSDFQRPITERIQKDFFSDPSQASIGCAKTSNIVRASKDIYRGKDGEEVFEQARSLLFKTLRVRRCSFKAILNFDRLTHTLFASLEP